MLMLTVKYWFESVEWRVGARMTAKKNRKKASKNGVESGIMGAVGINIAFSLLADLTPSYRL